MRVKIGSLIMVLALSGLLVWLLTPTNLFFFKPLYYGDNVISYGDCKIVKTPYNCVNTIVCDEVCNGFKVFDVCLGFIQKTNCRTVTKCDYKYETKCDKVIKDYQPSNVDVSCPSGTIYMNGNCINPYGGSNNYWKNTTTTTPTTSYCQEYETTHYRLECGGDLIQNKYIQGFSSIVERKVVTKCKCNVCKDYPTNEVRVVERCVDKLKVCRDDNGYPKCYQYPLELKINVILDSIKDFLPP